MDEGENRCCINTPMGFKDKKPTEPRHSHDGYDSDGFLLLTRLLMQTGRNGIIGMICLSVANDYLAVFCLIWILKIQKKIQYISVHVTRTFLTTKH